MARELVIHSWCDTCLAGDDRVDSERSVTLIATAGKPLELDLCGDHLLAIEQAVEMFEAFGHPPAEDRLPSKPAGQPRLRSPKGQTKKAFHPDSPQQVDLRCRLCPHVGSTPNATWQHARQIHGMTRAQYRAAPVASDSALAELDLLSA